MSLMRNPRFIHFLKWVSQSSVENPKISLKHRPFATLRPIDARDKPTIRSRHEIRKIAEVAMFDYFHHTRGLQFLIAESMSKNAPTFNDNLLKKLKIDSTSSDDDELVRSITRFLLFHPVNEFEPFLESLGLKPKEFSHLVPCDKMFLNEDAYLLENYHVFWNYGMCREKMGKIFKEAREVFGYETGVLASKIKAYEGLGFSKIFLSKLIVSSPSILLGNASVDLVLVMEMMKALGFGFDFVGENLLEDESYDWRTIHKALTFLKDLYKDGLCELIKERPRLVFENSGEWTLKLAAFETKLGLSRNEISLLFKRLQRSQGLERCVGNLRRCFLFLKDIEMEANEISKVFRSHSSWLSVSPLKQTSTLLLNLKGGKRRLCKLIQENPEEMKKWFMGIRVKPLQGTETKSKTLKIRFLSELGFKEDSKEMEKALKSFRGRGCELQERFNFLVSLGLSKEEVKDMVKASPDILTQASDIVESKVNYLVKELGYPLSTLVSFPSCLKYTLQRMKIRFEMFSWLQACGNVDPKLAVSTILVYSDKSFVTRFVNRHPDGPKHFEDLKKVFLCK